jgi:hypothetical protein
MGAPVRAEGGRSASGWLLQGCAMAGVGLAVGLACWPLNAIDRLQDSLISRLPAYGGGWTGLTLALALAPIATVPLLLVLQTGVLHRSAGSGLPQLLVALQRPERRDLQLAAGTTAGRLALWGAASLALLPIGREVQPPSSGPPWPTGWAGAASAANCWPPQPGQAWPVPSTPP